MRFRYLLVCLLMVLIALSFATNPSTAQSADPAALIDAVNELRLENGLSAYTSNIVLMKVAQAHSSYQASLGKWTHTGPDGSDETQRAVAAGYGSRESVKCDEAVAIAQTAQRAIELWQDPTHLSILLSPEFTEAGAGAVASGNLVYFTLNACYASLTVQGSPTATNSAASSAATAVPGSPFVTATPQEDGSIIHTVQAGENLFLIAQAYEVSPFEITALNNLTTDSVLYPGDRLIIRLEPTATATSLTTPTTAPTRTPRPTRTPTARATRTATRQPAPTATIAPSPTPNPSVRIFGATLTGIDPLLMAILILGGTGVALVFVGSVLKRSGR